MNPELLAEIFNLSANNWRLKVTILWPGRPVEQHFKDGFATPEEAEVYFGEFLDFMLERNPKLSATQMNAPTLH